MKKNHRQFFEELAKLCYRHGVVASDGQLYFRDGLLVDNEPGTFAESGCCEITASYQLTDVEEDTDDGLAIRFWERKSSTMQVQDVVRVEIENE